MDYSLKSTIRIRGGVTPYGTVTLSGDSDVTIFYLVQSFFSDKKIIFDNVPRSGSVLDFITVINKLGVQINWNNETSLSISVPNDVSHDLTQADFSYKFVQILIPALLFKKGMCILPSNFRNELKFYRQLGYDVEPEGNSITVRRNFVKLSETFLQVNVNRLDLYTSASRIFTKYFNNNLSIIDDPIDYRLKAVININPEDRIMIPHNQFEFNLFLSLASLASSEVTIENFNLSESLQYLLVFDEIAGNYEVEDGKLKVWRHQKELDELYEFLTLTPDAIGYLIIILSFISNKPVGIVCRKTSQIEEIITELNILGCKISYIDGPDNALINIRPVNNISTVRSEIVNPDWGGVLVFASLAARGYSRINNFNLLAYNIQYLSENLENLNLDIATI